MTEKIAGSGQHSHPVPQKDGRVVWCGDGNHDGTELYWSERRSCYVAVSHECEPPYAETGERLVLVRGGNQADHYPDPAACDWSSPDGLAFYWSPDDIPEGSEILWDSFEERSDS